MCLVAKNCGIWLKVLQTLTKYSLHYSEESQSARAASSQVRSDMENLLNTATSELVSHWNRTNQVHFILEISII